MSLSHLGDGLLLGVPQDLLDRSGDIVNDGLWSVRRYRRRREEGR